MLSCVDHVLVAVEDLDAAEARFAALLGRSASWRGAHRGTGTESAVFALSNTAVELVAAIGEGSLADVVRQQLRRSEGLFALALGTADAASCVKQLRERGLDVPDPEVGEAHDDAGAVMRRWHSFSLSPTDTRGLMVFVLEREGDNAPFAQAPAQSDAGIADAVDHIVIRTAQPDTAIENMGEKLGIRLALDRTFEPRQVRLLFFRLGGVTIEYAASLDPERKHRGADRLWGLSLRTTDIEAAHERLANAGFALDPVRDGHKPGTRVFTLKEPVLGIATLMLANVP